MENIGSRNDSNQTTYIYDFETLARDWIVKKIESANKVEIPPAIVCVYFALMFIRKTRINITQYVKRWTTPCS